MTNQRIGILIINGPLPPPFGGVATYLAYALPYLAGKGFEIHTVIDQKPADPQLYEQFERAGVHIHYGGGTRLQRVLRIIRHIPLWIATLRASGISFFLLLKTAKSIVSWLDVSERILQRHTIHIIHAYDYPWVQGFVAARLAKKYKKRYVQTTFGEVVPHQEELVHHDTQSEQFRPFAKFVLDQASLIISVSQHCARELNYLGVDAAKVKVCYHGVNTNDFFPSENRYNSKYKFNSQHVVLFLGQIRARKGPQVLLEAVPIVLNRISDTLFVFAGPDNGLLPYLQKRSKELLLEDRAIFTGPIPHEDLRALYQACDIFVFPTCTPIECLGLSMIQAMACGKPVVGSRINGIPEVIADGQTGYLVEPNNSQELAEKIIYLLKDAALRKTMGTEGLKKAKAVFNQENLVLELENLYRKVIQPI